MGNGIAKLSPCFSTSRRRRDAAAVSSDPCEEGLGHSFCYVRPELLAAKTEETTTFRSISGAAIGANASTPPSTSDLHALTSHLTWPAAAFDCSTSFSSVPLQPLPRFSSGPLSGPISDRGFLSGPIERAYLSGPIDPRAVPFSGPLDAKRTPSSNLLRRSLSRGATSNLLRGISKAIARTISVKRAVKSESLDSSAGSSNQAGSSERTSDDSDSLEPVSSGSNLQWAQGKAGEDRVHVVVSEEHGWVFVGIYDGFNGPDATDYLLANLYSALHRELKGLLWDDDKHESRELYDEKVVREEEVGYREGKQRRRFRGAGRKWNCDCERESSDLDRRSKKQQNKSNQREAANHLAVLKALSQALKKTEEAYLDIADKKVMENPELALMGSCVLVMLMKGEDVYLMNVGDSRAVLALKAEHDSWSSGGKERQDLEMISEEMNVVGDGIMDGLPSLAALQLTLDHSTSVDEEVHRIRNEHPNDACAIVNDRVKGSLKVTRAFGAGFLKRPKWNNALLEMFRIDYIGSTPYISCTPSLRHHKLGSRDRFLILSSDGLYQYFTNEEAVSQVELFIAMCPEGDPAQHLVEEVLFRAAEKAGMDFHELLEIPHGDRRRYHDDVSIIVVSLEGRIWRSCV